MKDICIITLPLSWTLKDIQGERETVIPHEKVTDHGPVSGS